MCSIYTNVYTLELVYIILCVKLCDCFNKCYMNAVYFWTCEVLCVHLSSACTPSTKWPSLYNSALWGIDPMSGPTTGPEGAQQAPTSQPLTHLGNRPAETKAPHKRPKLTWEWQITRCLQNRNSTHNQHKVSEVHVWAVGRNSLYGAYREGKHATIVQFVGKKKENNNKKTKQNNNRLIQLGSLHVNWGYFNLTLHESNLFVTNLCSNSK